MQHRSGFDRLKQAVFNLQLAHDALKLLAFQGWVVQCCRDDQPGSRKGFSELNKVLRPLIVIGDKACDDQIEFGGGGVRTGSLPAGAVLNEMFHPRQGQFDQPF